MFTPAIAADLISDGLNTIDESCSEIVGGFIFIDHIDEFLYGNPTTPHFGAVGETFVELSTTNAIVLIPPKLSE